MNKYLCSAVALFAGLYSHAALAEADVYGLVDTGIEYVTKTTPTGSSVVRIPSLTGSAPSRLGFRGVENLGGDVQAVFALEAGISLDTGTLGQGNRLFGRLATIGLKSSLGTLTLGRQYSMTALSLSKADVMGPSIHALSNMDTYLPNARTDNSIGYLGKFNAVTVGATYSLGRDGSAAGGPAATNCAGELGNDAQACRQVTGLLAYDAASFGVATAYDRLNGGPGAGNGLTSSAFHVERISLNGYVLVKHAKIGLGVIQRKTHAATDNTADLYFVGASYPLTLAWVLDTQVARLSVRNSADASTLYAARATYQLSKRTAAYASVGHIRNAGAAGIPVSAVAGPGIGAGMHQSGVMTGIRHSF